MKKGKVLFIAAIVSVFMPFVVNAKEAANVYLFKGKTCGYCAKALEFFEDLQEDKNYKDKFNLVQYEIWYNEGNAKLANDVADELGDELDGVPYIVIGEKTFSGYTSGYDDDIKKAIDNYYEEENRKDVVAQMLSKNTYEDLEAQGSSGNTGSASTNVKDESKNTDTIIAIGIILVAVVGFGYIIYLSRKDTSVPEKKKVETKKVEEKKEEQEEIKDVKEPAQPKQTAKKKQSTKKKSNSKKTTKK